MKKMILFGSICGIIFTGCSQKYVHVTIESFPRGAQIIDHEKNQSIGATPLNGYVPFTKIFGTDNPTSCITQSGFTLIWPSGATATMDTVQFCPDTVNKFLTLNRPAEAPNLEYDLKNAEMLNEQQKINLIKQQTETAQKATESADLADGMKVLGNSLQQVGNTMNQNTQNTYNMMNNMNMMNRQTNCTTSYYGNQAFTNCR